VKINGEMHYLWRAVDHEGEILESYVTKSRDKKAALAFMKRALKRHGSPEAITTDGLRSYRAAMTELGNEDKQEVGGGLITAWRTATCLSDEESGRCCGYDKCTAYRSSPRFTPTSTTTSILSATSSIEKPTSSSAQPPWPSGRSTRARLPSSKTGVHRRETSSHWTDTTL
jgi:hypothetical protein